MRLRSAAAASVILVCVPFATGQETRPVAEKVLDLARGTASQRLAALLYLEDARSADLAPWKALLDGKDDAAFLGRVVRGLGRVGEPELLPLLVEVLTRDDGPWISDVQRAAALAVGLFGDPELMTKLAAKATARDVFFAAGLMKKAPPPAPGPAAESRPGASEETFTDPLEAMLRWGAVIDPPPFASVARDVLPGEGIPRDHLRAAADYFARSKAKAPADVQSTLAAMLNSEHPETAGLAARALAKSEGAGDAEAAAIAAAFERTNSTITQVDEARALAALPVSGTFAALPQILAVSKRSPQVSRTVLETANALAAKLPPETKKLVASVALSIVKPDPTAPPPAADVEAAAIALLAALDPERFTAMLPSLRLAARWQARAAAGAAVATVQKPDVSALLTFLRDPDRRVRIAALEAFGDNVSKFEESDLKRVFDSLIEARFPNGAPEQSWSAPLTFDPVEISLIAKSMMAVHHPLSELFAKTVLDSHFPLVPSHEVEALQSVLDLAGSIPRVTDPMHPLMPPKPLGTADVLKRFLWSPEISLRKRAMDLLKKNGIDAKEQPPTASAPVLMAAASARAEWLLSNPKPRVVIETTQGNIKIELFASDAPATVENFLKLAKSGFYDGILWHRVVPAFVAQAGCPRGDGWGGPGYTIRCEVNDRTYRRGSVGMALAGKDTGGCQFFICHRALPHLDGRYTLFGQVVEGMETVDRLGQEDYILKVREE